MPRTVLIVNGSQSEQTILSDLLKDSCGILTASGRAEALHALRERGGAISAILLDAGTPEAGGYEMLQDLRRSAVYGHLPVIVTLNPGDGEGPVRAMSLGANGALFRPYQGALTACTVKNVMDLYESAISVSTLREDALTGLQSRAAFLETAETMAHRKQPGFYILSCFDIENFKVINDLYGVETGDGILKSIAGAIRRCMEALDGICCRFAADRFGLMYPAAFRDSREIHALHQAAACPENFRRRIKLRIGRCLVDDLSVPISAMYDRATLAEESIRGRYDTFLAEYTDAMRSSLLHEQHIVNDMDRALAAGEFEPWFQPQFNHATGAMIGAEALVRWRKGGRIIPPDEFVPVFERNGFVYEMDQSIWRQVCALLRRWLDAGQTPLPVSINISRYDVFQETFPAVLYDLVAEYKIPTDLLRLEITESAFAERTKTIVNVTKSLIRRGFTVEIDDFGSGYSSLNTLKDVPASILKLDMKFFEHSENTQRGGNIVESVVRMAKRLGMAVIAEGVEDLAQADYLKSIGCFYIQGYFYAKPMPAGEYQQLEASRPKEAHLTRLQTLETLDNNEFWNPKSMETLIFNSYVGGACILEYCREEAALLRVNDQYIKELGPFAPDSSLPHNESPVRCLDQAGRAALLSCLRDAIASGREAVCELKLSDGAGQSARTGFFRFTARAIASADEHYLFYCAVLNMTEQRTAELKERETSDMLRAVMNSAGNGITAIVLEAEGPKFLFANDRYYEILGLTREDYRNRFDRDPLTVICADDRAAVSAAAEKAMDGRTSAQVEARISRGDGALRWIRVVITVTNPAGFPAPVQIGVFSDVTAEKESRDQLRFLNDSAHEILAQPDSGKAIRSTLEKLLHYFSGDRSYVIELDYANKVSRNTYEQCAPGVTGEMARLQAVPFGVSVNWLDALQKNQFVVIDSVEGLDESQAELRAILLAQGIHSIIIAPLWRSGVLVGFVGVDNPTKATGQLGRLMALGDYIAVLLTRRDLHAKIDSDREMMAALMRDTPGGFVRMKLGPDGTFVPLYSNDGFRSLVGMTREALQSLYGRDILAGVHPDDRDIVTRAGRQLLADGKAGSARFRILRGDGSYLWITLYGRAMKDASGETYLNVYYTDATAQIKEEQLQKALLDNLPCGAALYEYDGSTLAVIHINKRYWQLVGREPADYSNASVFDMIHPDDVSMTHQEIEAAIRQGREAAVDLRVFCGDGTFRPFHISATITPQPEGTYLFYASYTPISQQTMSLQEMLPVALSTMMSASEDLSYVKDRDLRYLCCSRSFARALGLSSQRDLIGRTSRDLFPKELADGFDAEDRRVIEAGTSVIDCVEKVPLKNGGIRLSNTSKYPILDPSGRVIGLYGISRDVTAERKRDFELHTLLNSIPSGILKYSADDREAFAYVSRNFIESLGYTQAQFREKFHNCFREMVFAEDRDRAEQEILRQESEGKVGRFDYRIEAADGQLHWFHDEGIKITDQEGKSWYYVTLVDITEQKKIQENLRVSEEMNRIAIEHSGNIITRFDVKSRTLVLPASFNPIFVLPPVLRNMPQEQIALGRVSPDTADVYTELFEGILRGSPSGSATYQQNSTKGWRWLEAQYTTVFSNTGQPVSAVITFTDVTELLEKEVVYNKWQQSLSDRPDGSYTMLRCNLGKNGGFDSREGSLLPRPFGGAGKSFDQCMEDYARQHVFPDDRETYCAFLHSGAMLAGYHRGRRSGTLEYREALADGSVRWVRLSVDLVAYPNSKNVEAYLMYEDIDAQKKAELLTLARSETDPLTGVLNRAAFIGRAEHIIRAAAPGEQHALFMLDIDEFKQVNDTMGHGAGDQILVDLTRQIRSILRRDDLIGRLGGDEFFVFLRGIPGQSLAARKAEQICSMKLYAGDSHTPVTASIGVAMVPRDGKDFDTLYKKVDAALYQKKRFGKAGYLFVSQPADG